MGLSLALLLMMAPAPGSAGASGFEAPPGTAWRPPQTLAWSAQRPRQRYSVTVPIGPPRPAPAPPKIEGPADGDLPLVVIDPGHGGHDPGAVSPHSRRREKDITLALARAIRDELVASGRVRVALTRTDDRFLILEERYGIARQLKADLFISVHADAADSADAQGASIYTLAEVASDREAARLAARENKANVLNGVDLGGQSSAVASILIDLAQRETLATAASFAQLLLREAGDEIRFRTTAHRYASFVVLKAPDTPSVLFEAGFLSNARDDAFLASPAGRRSVARGVRRAVQIHFARKVATEQR